jgi:4-amino-4-deoxychorismate lyase
MKIPLLSTAEAQQKMLQKKQAHQGAYYAMYSSWLGGIVTDPALMTVPLDDHLVHRGDGVFEAMKCVEGRIYLMPEHLNRLFISAEQIALKSPFTQDELKDIILQTARASRQKNATIRLYLSRGPGSFTPNPYDSVGAQVYLAVTSLKPMPAEKYTQGVRIGRSAIPVKDSWLARAKTCNYIPNVMMRKEAVDRGLDFTVGFDAEGFLTESSTENIVLVDKSGCLVHPQLQQILSGTTMKRSFEMAKSLKGNLLTGIETKNISLTDILEAREVMMAGTTLDILPVVEFERQKIHDGNVGPVAKKILELLRQDLKNPTQTTLI